MGREYAGEDPRIGPWRDIQLEITGDAARKFQMIFADDWFFATEEKLLDARYYPQSDHRQSHLVQPMPDDLDGADDPIEMSIVLMLNSGAAVCGSQPATSCRTSRCSPPCNVSLPEEWICEYSFQRRRITRC